MKKYIFVLAILMMFPLISSINVSVEKLSEEEVLVVDLEKPVKFELKMDNFGKGEDFEFYNLLGFQMFPSGKTYLPSGSSKIVEMGLYPIGNFKIRGYYTFSYYIRNQAGEEEKEELTFKVIELGEALAIGSGGLDPETNQLEVYIENLVNFDFDELNITFSSPFFESDQQTELKSKEKVSFNVDVNKDDFRKLMAGFYTLTADITSGSQKATIEGVVKFVEKDILTTSKKDYGFIISTKIIEKVNEGNTIKETETVLKKNILSRLFTSFSPEPDFAEREGNVVYYTWVNEIKPGETLEIIVKTNWLFPLVIILFIIAIVILAKQFSRTNLILRKRVHFVRAKGGEFGLKVSVFVNAKKYVEKVNVIDRLPPLVKIFHRFGGEEPTKVDENTRRIQWNFEKLEAGETRMLSYIIYSKVGVIGKFALPSTTAVYEKEGKVHEAISNKAFFVAEQRKGEKKEE